MSALVPAPRPSDTRAHTLRVDAFAKERRAIEIGLQADVDPERSLLAEIARRHADDAWNLLWLYLDGLIA